MKKYLSLLAVVLLLAGMITACGSSGSSPAADVTTSSTVETTGSSGAWTINMKGGTGGTSGGTGGYWYTETYGVQGVKLMKAGTAATSFSVPNYKPPVDLGSNACIVTSNTTLVVHPSGAATDPASGVLYMVGGSGSIYKGSSAGAVTLPYANDRCTGLRVAAGVTLTLGLNYDTDANGVYDYSWADFASDVEIIGKVQAAALTTAAGTPDTRHGAPGTSSDMGAIDLESFTQMFIRPTGSIIAKGINGSSARGGDGGEIYLAGGNFFINQGIIDNSGGNGSDQTSSSTTDGGWAGVVSGSFTNGIKIEVKGGTGPVAGTSGKAGGVFVNTGKINSNGGNGATGGETSQIFLDANSDFFNTGPISSNGGTGTNGNGGNGNWDFYIYSFYGSISNSGALSQRGGNGAFAGGNGGYFYISAADSGYSGDIVNSGAITADAGSAMTSGSSGSSPSVYMYAYGAIMTSGKLSANGGDSKGSNTGGTGGYLYLENYVPYDYEFGEYMPIRPIQISGNIYLNGGSSQSGAGGAAGSFYTYQSSSSSSAKSNTGIQLLGYASANLSGGDGATSGHAAYDMYIYTYNDYANVGYYSPAGPIQNQIAITMKGGNVTGSSGGGGLGGYLEWQTSENDNYSGGGLSMIVNSGKIDVSGGNGGSSTGNGGHSNEIYWYGQDGVKNSGPIVLRGGNSVGNRGGDGAYNDLWIYASGDIVNSGAIDTTGGKGTTGGNGSYWSSGTPFGNWVHFYAGGKVTNTGAIKCPGGVGTTTNGNGGGIDILSEKGGTSNTGALNVARGAGGGAAAGTGLNGQAWIDWVQVQ